MNADVHMNQMNVLKAVTWLGLLGFVGYSIAWLNLSSVSVFTGLASIFVDPWSITFGIFLDLILGLILFSIIIYLNAESKKVAAIWIVALFAIGNVVSAIYLLFNWKKIAVKISTGLNRSLLLRWLKTKNVNSCQCVVSSEYNGFFK